MTPGQKELLEAILDTRQLAPEVQQAVQVLIDQEDGAVTWKQVSQLVRDLLKAPEFEDAEYLVGGVIER